MRYLLKITCFTVNCNTMSIFLNTTSLYWVSLLLYHVKKSQYFEYKVSLFKQKVSVVLPFLPGTYRPFARSSLPRRYEEPVAPSGGRWRSSSPQKAQMTPWRAPKWCEWFCKPLSSWKTLYNVCLTVSPTNWTHKTQKTYLLGNITSRVTRKMTAKKINNVSRVFLHPLP